MHHEVVLHAGVLGCWLGSVPAPLMPATVDAYALSLYAYV